MISVTRDKHYCSLDILHANSCFSYSRRILESFFMRSLEPQEQYISFLNRGRVW